MITLEPASRSVKGAVVTRLGYCHCVDCWTRTGEPLDRAQAYPRFVEEASLGDDPQCDACGEPIAACSPLIVEGVAVVEHVPCKIF
jgi:hypothetical protein